MSTFNRLTVVAAIEVIEGFHSHNDMKVHEEQWDIAQYLGAQTAKSGRIAAWAKVAIQMNPTVWTEDGQMPLQRAIVDLAKSAPESERAKPAWRKYLAGLRFDGFEIVTVTVPDPSSRKGFDGQPKTVEQLELKRMLPADVPEMDFRESESEVEALLAKHGLSVAAGHLAQARSSFQRGEWAGANAQLRTFVESYLSQLAAKLGYAGNDNMNERLKYLGELEPPFLLPAYNEWHANDQKPQYVKGLWSRMHPEGSHPGLSEEEDATFRLQITLISARLLLRRFDKRILLP